MARDGERLHAEALKRRRDRLLRRSHDPRSSEDLMAGGVSFYGRKGDPDTSTAQKFLQQHKYRPDETLDIDATRPDWGVVRKLFGGSLWAIVDTRYRDYGDIFPRGSETMTEEELEAMLDAMPALVKVPLLLTPKGGLAGFREQRWRLFLDIGKEQRG